MFFRKREVTLGRVRDKVTFREGDEKIEMRVDVDAARIMAGLKSIQATLDDIDPADADAMESAAQRFAVVLFGEEQAKRLREFYGGDAGTLIRACGQYTRKFLLEKVTKAQEKANG